jgi:hypothetical protein
LLAPSATLVEKVKAVIDEVLAGSDEPRTGATHATSLIGQRRDPLRPLGGAGAEGRRHRLRRGVPR